MEAIEQTWNGSSTTDGRCTATISRNGDLVSRMYIEIKTDNSVQSNNLGLCWIKTVELEIGGQKIDKHSGYWMETWAELTEKNSTGFVTNCVTTEDGSGLGTLFQRMSGMGGVSKPVERGDYHYHIPLFFWFCRNPGLALPLIALQYHEVKIILDHNIVTGFGGTPINNLWCDYIYLDTDERRRFAQVSHEYLIEQVQEQSIPSAENSVDLNFNHPVKELIWMSGHVTISPGLIDCYDLTSPSASTADKYRLKLNGHDRFAERPHSYFSRVQVWEHHTGFGGHKSTEEGDDADSANDAICVYSFALKPEEHQPSGTCNFSRIDNAQLVTSGAFNTSASLKIFAVNYNVLRIMSGMGGLAYSN